MEQPAILHIQRAENVCRFRLDLPEGPNGQEYITEFNADTTERLRRALQTAAQQMQALAITDFKQQAKRNTAYTAMVSLGRFLFETMIPVPLQEALRRLDTPLLLNTNTPDIPWEVLFDGKSSSASSNRFLCQSLSIGRQGSAGRASVGGRFIEHPQFIAALRTFT